MRREQRNWETGQHDNTGGTHGEAKTANDKLTHERFGHASLKWRCEPCVKVRGTPRHHPQRCVRSHMFEDATVKNSQQDSEVQILRDASAKIEELDLFLDVLNTHHLDNTLIPRSPYKNT